MEWNGMELFVLGESQGHVQRIVRHWLNTGLYNG